MCSDFTWFVSELTYPILGLISPQCIVYFQTNERVNKQKYYYNVKYKILEKLVCLVPLKTKLCPYPGEMLKEQKRNENCRRAKSAFHLVCIVSVGQEIRDRFSGAVEAFARRNNPVSGSPGDHSRHRSSDYPSSKDVNADSDRGRSSRNGSTSKRAIASSRPSSSGEPSDSRSSRLHSTSGRMSTTHRVQPGFESKTSTLARAPAARPVRDDALRSFEFLSIGTSRRK